MKSPITSFLAVALIASAAGCSARTGTTEGSDRGNSESCESVPGVSKDSIKLGGSYPASGPLSSGSGQRYGASAYFKYLNEEKGGVNGRKIEFKQLDDAYQPTRTLVNARRLVEREDVFAMFNVFGTGPNIAVTPYLDSQEVPNIFPVSGASRWGKDLASGKHPWTIPWQVSLLGEGRVFADYVADENPTAKVAVLSQNDDFGKDALDGFKDGIEGTDIEIVKELTYEPSDASITAQVGALSDTDADVFLDITTQKFAAQAIKRVGSSDWDPLHLTLSINASVGTVIEPAGLDNAEGLVSTAYLKDPSDPRWADDEEMKLYLKEAGDRIPSTAKIDDQAVAIGWSTAATLAHALEGIDCVNRPNVMKALTSIDAWSAPLLLPGVQIETSDKDPFPIETVQIMRFDGEAWELIGETINAQD